MAILKIARMGHPVLRRRAAEVPDPAAPEIGRLVADMIETVADAQGLGLAAPQVHVAWRVVVFHAPGDGDGEDATDDPPRLTVLVNPTVEPLDGEREEGWEGCLSVPGLRGLVPRFARVRYGGFTLRGEAVEHTAEGLHARVVQHECDHLDGILYPMRMTDLSKLIFDSEFRHLRAAGEGEADEAAEVECMA